MEFLVRVRVSQVLFNELSRNHSDVTKMMNNYFQIRLFLSNGFVSFNVEVMEVGAGANQLTLKVFALLVTPSRQLV